MMAVFKCKMCGGTLEINNNETVAVCEYCGTKQTLPKLDDEKRVQLYDRANHFRRENEFDKAMGIYEMILSDDKEDCESYWGIVLCRYGIEYVEDPRTHKRIPTVNRAQFTSIFDDDDYKNAIKYADGYQKDVYEAEASVIDKIQKGILEISNKEEPFDVFICYKETDSHGNRTQDSVYAQDIYAALTKEGYKVFFSRITLEDKLGSAYEPYIFAALNSAKVMLVVGTEKDNFNAVWVKNEWSRYISLIKAGKDKTLIPVYKDISPYDMPEEFQYLQSQDMGKIGFMQDLIRGISKLIDTNKTEKETFVVSGGNTNVAPLLERAFMFLEDADWANADEYCEKVLDLDPKNAEAYLGKLMAELRVRKQEELVNCEQPFDKSNNYQKSIRFADNTLATTLNKYVEKIKQRNENDRKERIYNESIKKINSEYIDEIEKAINQFKQIADWKDSQEQILICKQRIEAIEIQKEQEHIEREKRAKQERREKEKRNKKKKTIVAVILSAVSIIVAFAIFLVTVIIPRQKFNDIVSISAGCTYTVGLKSDGTVVAVGANDYGQCNVSGWTDIVAISAGVFQTVGLKSDGTVVAVGDTKYDKCNVSDWKDIVAVSAGVNYTVGLKSDGTVIAVGLNDYGQCNVSGWNDIVAISAGQLHTVGLNSDGTVVATGCNVDGECNVNDWTDVIAISTGESHTVGLKSDGTVVAVGDNDYGQCNVSGLTDIVAISAGDFQTVGLKSDGTVVAVGPNSQVKCDVEDWKDIVAISAGDDHTVGLKSDGTVVAIGENYFGQCLVGHKK